MTGNSNPIADIAARFGGQTALGRAIDTAQGTVWEWVSKGRVPSSRIPDIIAAGAKQAPPIHLEPNDFFARAEEAA